MSHSSHLHVWIRDMFILSPLVFRPSSFALRLSPSTFALRHSSFGFFDKAARTHTRAQSADDPTPAAPSRGRPSLLLHSRPREKPPPIAASRHAKPLHHRRKPNCRWINWGTP